MKFGILNLCPNLLTWILLPEGNILVMSQILYSKTWHFDFSHTVSLFSRLFVSEILVYHSILVRTFYCIISSSYIVYMLRNSFSFTRKSWLAFCQLFPISLSNSLLVFWLRSIFLLSITFLPNSLYFPHLFNFHFCRSRHISQDSVSVYFLWVV